MNRVEMLLSRMKSGEPEIFGTVQGEGASVGVPSVFVRLADCNLRCTWCDTKYTWDWTSYDRGAETVELAVDDVARVTLRLAGEGIRNAVFTGGEPLLQQDELALLAHRLVSCGFQLEIETNGTVLPNPALEAAVRQWNVSPKLAASGNAERARLRPSALEWFGARPNALFKFVVASDADLAEALDLAKALGLPGGRVLLSPEGVDAATLAERSR